MVFRAGRADSRTEPGVNFSCDKKKPTDFPVTRKNAVMRDDFAPGLSVQIEGFHPVPTLPPLRELSPLAPQALEALRAAKDRRSTGAATVDEGTGRLASREGRGSRRAGRLYPTGGLDIYGQKRGN